MFLIAASMLSIALLSSLQLLVFPFFTGTVSLNASNVTKTSPILSWSNSDFTETKINPFESGVKILRYVRDGVVPSQTSTGMGRVPVLEMAAIFLSRLISHNGKSIENFYSVTKLFSCIFSTKNRLCILLLLFSSLLFSSYF
jgi:hypothetical protein